MSNRDSMGFGDLLPQDVVEVFAQERQSKRGRKKRSNSLGRALGWLKGKKRKDLGANGQSLGLGPALDLALDGHPAGYQGGHKGGQKSGKQNHPYGNSHAVPKRNDGDKAVAPPLLQENVFIETSRPKYLEDLHSEALEGLKLMQQEENNSGVEFRDNESTISTMTAQTDGESGGFITDSTIADTTSVVSVQSSVSTRSSRSGLTRQGSTFRPLNSGKKVKRGRHRKTVGGIPQHVRREMGLDRVDWTLTERSDKEQLYNGETDTSTTSDGSEQTPGSPETSVDLPDMKIIQPLNKAQTERLGGSHAGHRDDLALLSHHLGPGVSDEPRPRSLAVPSMTTANGEQPGPVMSMSPQAAYMSKIIPNAVLLPSIEVLEISRGRSRNSVRTVGKGGLLLSSPASSRASSRASSSRTTSSRASTITSASRYNPPHLSDSSCWTTSESSDTLVSDSSTISSSTTPRQKRSHDGDASAKEDGVSVHSSISKASKCTSNGRVLGKVDEAKRDGQFVRSLSVMKPKRAPPPPSRSYSLHNKMKRRSRDLRDIRIVSGESSPKTISCEENKDKSQYSTVDKIDSPSYHADTSSLDDSMGSGSFSPFKSQLQPLKEGKAAKVEKSATKDASQEKQGNKLSKVISPSSGYSSQDAMSPHSSSPRPKKGLLAKLQRLFPLHNSAGSAPSSDKTKAGDDSVDTVNVSPSVRALRDLFNIPPPPKVHAPPPPPPEVWAHSKRSVELLLGPPVPENLYAIIKKNPKDRRQQRQSPSASTEGSLKSLVSERKQKTPGITVESANGSVRVLETKMVQESRMMKSEMSKENNERLAQNVNLKGNIQTTEKDKVSDKLNGMLMKAAEKREEKFIAMRDHAKKTSTQATDALHISPSPSPKQSAGQTVASPETSWPPPPPPSVPQVGIGGPEEVDFPLPPPPLFGAVGLVIPERSSSSQETAQPTLTIPPPPPYSAPPPPLKEPSPSTTEKIFLPSKDAFPPPPEAFAPSPFTKVLPPPPKEFAPTPATVASPPPPPPPAAEVPPPVSAVVSPPPPPASAVVSPPPPPASAVVSPPPPPASTVVSPPPPPASTVVSPPPPPASIVVSPPPPPASTVVSPPPPPASTVVSPPPAQFAAEVPPPASTVVSPPPPPSSTAVPPPVSTVVASARPKESPLQVHEVKDVSHTSVKVASPSTIQEVSPLPPEEISTESSVDSALVGMLTPPSSIPPPPPLPSQRQSSDKDVAIPQETTQSKPETSPVSCNSILTPPQSIPPPPSIELLHQPQIVPRNTNTAATQEDPPSKVSVQPAPEISPLSEKAQEPVSPPPPPLPPSLPVQSLATITHQPSSANTENQNQELTSVTNTAQKEEPVPIVTPSLLQMVKLRSVNSSLEPPKAPDLPQPEVTRKEVPSIEVPTSSATGETPQKPIRKSLIITSASPPVIIEPQSALPKSQSLVVPTASSSTALSPTKKSPTTTGVPSMNLQEVIRMRTASKSRESPASRLSVNSPTSPIDPLHSPSSTASFIFSKSYKKMVIETKPASQAKAAAQNNQEAPKVVSEAESLKAGVKVPPPVAKKPKTKGRENETSEETEQTAGQEGEQEDAAEKRNGTAGTVEGGGTAST